MLAGGVFAELPTFDDFRRVDRARRVMGQMQTAELLEVNQISSVLLARTATQYSNDVRVVWGAAELMVLWSNKQPLYETALRLSSNSVPIAVRYACAAARQGDYETGLRLARYVQTKDTDNLLAWLIEIWIRQAQKDPQPPATEPTYWASSFRDYTVEATQARVRLLEKAGYSAYSARRLGFRADSDALLILKEVAAPPIPDYRRKLLKESGIALQHSRQFLLHELVGQTVERTIAVLRPDAATSPEVRVRTAEIEKRRDELKELLATLERDVIDYATEKQMINYFDDVLALGEEEAMKKLAALVRRVP
jgi:hypothetical protein